MWHHLYVDDPDEAFAFGNRLLQEALQLAARIEAPAPSVWTRLDRETGGVHYYFSPPAEALARAHGASACALPSRDDLGSLLFGEQPTAGDAGKKA
jgi:hypothetical protein